MVSYSKQLDRASAFVVDTVEIFLTSSLITMQNLIALSRTVCAHVRGPKNLGDAGARNGDVWLIP